MAEVKKATAKVTAKAAPVKEEVKAAEVKTEAKDAPKAEVKKASKARTKTAVKKTTAKKEPAKTTEVKKTAAKKVEVKETVNFQFNGKSYTPEDLLKSCRDVWKYDLGGKEEDFESVELYVKPEENTTYYVINGEITGSFFI